MIYHKTVGGTLAVALLNLTPFIPHRSHVFFTQSCFPPSFRFRASTQLLRFERTIRFPHRHGLLPSQFNLLYSPLHQQACASPVNLRNYNIRFEPCRRGVFVSSGHIGSWFLKLRHEASQCSGHLDVQMSDNVPPRRFTRRSTNLSQDCFGNRSSPENVVQAPWCPASCPTQMLWPRQKTPDSVHLFSCRWWCNVRLAICRARRKVYVPAKQKRKVQTESEHYVGRPTSARKSTNKSNVLWQHFVHVTECHGAACHNVTFTRSLEEHQCCVAPSFRDDRIVLFAASVFYAVFETKGATNRSALTNWPLNVTAHLTGTCLRGDICEVRCDRCLAVVFCRHLRAHSGTHCRRDVVLITWKTLCRAWPPAPRPLLPLVNFFVHRQRP